MRLGHLNLLTAAVSLCGSVIWMLTGNVAVGLVWFGISIVWLTIGLWTISRSSEVEGSPVQKLVRRVSRLLLFFSII